MESIGTPWLWTIFTLIVLFLLLLDLGVFHRKAHVVSGREALIWSIVWVVLSLAFGYWIYAGFGPKPGLEYLTGYLIEKALSMDNVFVFILIFQYFVVPAELHHRVLFWGVVGALVMRAAFILAGAVLISTFHGVLYIFGAFLVYTGIKIMRQGETQVSPEANPVVRAFQRLLPLHPSYSGGKFFVREGGKLMATPLALVLVTVETTDVVFAVDSIPAIFGITKDPFIVFTSNVGAILGLRALFFLLAAVMRRFIYLGTGLGLVLVFVGIKMLVEDLYKVPIVASLTIVAVILGGSIILSLLKSRRRAAASIPPAPLVESAGEKPDPEE